MRNISYFSKSLLAVAISTAMTQQVLAKSTEQHKQQLETIEVVEKQENPIKDQMVTSHQDLVRYSTDMGVSETGRFGSQGFSLRGVEGNQVAMTIDGVTQAASNNYSTFSRYSYYNRARIQAETDLMGAVDIEKGSSTTVGNGALGGAVNYQTKTVNDILPKDRQLGGVIKYTYNGRNREHIKTFGIAGDSQYVDALVMYSHRAGTETQIPSKGPDIMGYGRGIPNPYKNDQYSYLAKLGIKWHNEHRVEWKALTQRSRNDGQELSYSPTTLRHTQDIQKLASYGVSYFYTPSNQLIDNLKFSLSKQKTEMSGQNDQVAGPRFENAKRTFITTALDSTLGVSLKPLNWGNTPHLLTTQLGYGKSDFRFDKQIYKTNMPLVDNNMQPPAEMQSWFFLFGDNIRLNHNVSAHINVRYERTTFSSEDHRLSDKTFNNWAGDIALAYQVLPSWQVAYKVSRGFRTPTAIDLFFNRSVTATDIGSPLPFNQTFKANPDLKPETSLSHELTLSGNGELGRLSMTAYHTQYKNMIDLATLALYSAPLSSPRPPSIPPSAWVANYGTYQFQNLNNAKITGIDVNGTLDLNAAWTLIPQGFELNAGLGYAKGKRSDGADLLSVQPLKALFGLGYRAPNNDWAVHLNATYTQGKKAKDAQHYALIDRLTPVPANGAYLSREKHLSTYPYLSQSATLFDLVAHKHIGESAVLKAGIYNLLNKKYWSWDSLRSISDTNPTVASRVSGEGLNRFLAPERYVMISMEFKF
ncbi:MAG: TonB-dependent hemoglobin/transferrin/lactoferrin family receptor [Lonepinella koalarum]|nr:TonB-dependent hemoglobin/transferrin/lactoferrin family receptor [Lonepinella koalarum]